MTATADYGVSIVEDFTPPKDMTPGQKVNKDVSVVNTGSVDAFVRLALKDYINMSKLGTTDVTTTLDTALANTKTYFIKDDGTITSRAVTAVNASDNSVTDSPLQAGETKLYVLRKFLDTYTAPTDPNTKLVELNPMEKTNADGTKEANEVTTLMAGGRVMVAESTAVAPDKQTVRSGDDVNGDVNGFAVIYKYTKSGDPNDGKLFVPSGTNQYAEVTLNQNGLYEKTGTDTTLDTDKLSVAELARDYSGAGQYTPQEKGLYIFQRTGTNNTNSNTITNPTYSGFYYDKNAGKFYALKTQTAQNTDAAAIPAATNSTAVLDGANITLENNADGSQVVKAISGIKLLNKKSEIKNSADDKWTFKFYQTNKTTEVAVADVNANTTKYIKATFTPNGSAKTVDFWIELDDNWNDTWQYVAGSPLDPGYASVDGDKGELGYFYYKKKLESGETSKRLIDSVTLDSTMTTENFLDLTYDLSVVLDSVQVTKDQYGDETTDAVPYSTNSGITTTDTDGKNWATPAVTKNAATDATPIAGDGINGTIDSIAWS